MKKLRPIMFVGTGSDVGKSVINAAFCRIFVQDGYHPAPFKAQNMSLNSYATPEGLEIGRAQAVQAEACGIVCHTDMNPVLLKPNNNTHSQVVVNGKVAGNQSAKEYFAKNKRINLFPVVTEAFNRLAERYNPIVMEGAGSISEVNLWDRDIVNMPMALHANAAVYLVADIDRGGVFGSVYGSLKLLREREQKQVKGILINKFRGDIDLFRDGAAKLEELTGVPVVGIVPYYKNISIDDEDSVVLDRKSANHDSGKVRVAVVLLRQMSNFTDFNTLERHPDCHLYYAAKPSDLESADIIILPGSKNTISDLQDIRERGIAKKILDEHQKGKTVVGICGGYQMLGRSISDPLGVEGEISTIHALGLLPLHTEMSGEKITRQCTFSHRGLEGKFTGYEIHMGQTRSEQANLPSVNCMNDGTPDGFSDGAHCWGTYIHGIFDHAPIVEALLKPFAGIRENTVPDAAEFKEKQYNALAHLVRSHCNMELIYQHLSE